MRGAGDIAIKLSEAGGKGFTIMAADFGDFCSTVCSSTSVGGTIFGTGSAGASRRQYATGRSILYARCRYPAHPPVRHRPLFCSISGSGAGSVVESVVVVVVTPGMDTAWAGAPSRQKRMNRIHRMTPPVRKQSKKISIDAGEGRF